MRANILLLLVFCCLPEVAYPATMPDLTDFSTLGTGLEDYMKALILTWNGIISPVSMKLLVSLSIIQLVLIGSRLIFAEASLSSIFAELVKFILLVGFAIFLIQGAAPGGVLDDLIRSFVKLGYDINGFSTNKILAAGNDLMEKLSGEVSLWNAFWKGVKHVFFAMLVGAAAIIMVIVSFAIVLKNYIFGLIAIAISPLLVAVSVLEYTRSWMLAAITLIIKYGLKMMLVMLVAGMSLDLIADALNEDMTLSGLLAVLSMSFIMFEVIQEAENIVEALFSGSHHSSGSLFSMGKK